MVVFELEGVEIDRCIRCGGTWLDSGELEQLSGLSGGARGNLSRALEGGPGDPKGSRRCVRCRSRMRLVRVHEVELDRCPRGHGLWFDRSEMEAVVSSFKESGDGHVVRFLKDLHPPPKKGG
jgi:Zn-finger nucleic acid-binding protein